MRRRLNCQFFLTVTLDGSECLAPFYTKQMGWDRAVDKETFCGLDGLEFLSQWMRDFPHKSRVALGTIQPPV